VAQDPGRRRAPASGSATDRPINPSNEYVRYVSHTTGFTRVSSLTYGQGKLSRLRAGLSTAGRRDRGQALVEFALMIPILMLVLVGIVKGGILFNK
jgi:TadE-like protein